MACSVQRKKGSSSSSSNERVWMNNGDDWKELLLELNFFMFGGSAFAPAGAWVIKRLLFPPAYRLREKESERPRRGISSIIFDVHPHGIVSLFSFFTLVFNPSNP
jgi:hypothetical protein